MSRCNRCNACESMWETSACKHCNYPGDDSRTPGQIDIDNADMEEFYKESEL